MDANGDHGGRVRRRRLVWRGAVSVVIGLLVTVVAAWMPVVLRGRVRGTTLPTHAVVQDRERALNGHLSHNGLGAHYVSVQLLHEDSVDAKFGTWPGYRRAPRWARLSNEPPPSSPARSVLQIQHAVYGFGWPFVALRAGYRDEIVRDPPYRIEVINYPSIPDGWLLTNWKRVPRLPVRPYWPGLIGNVMVVSVPVFVLLTIVAAARTAVRRRRRLCERCSYPVDAARAVCPECGLAREATTEVAEPSDPPPAR